ncbi:MAG: iron-sulfur cluster assembly scaffold protein [Alphaproteobacteria bacterium]|nr:iron-sulfur cluster assembly scaffold protein [Alphaproteobacteria bacterium]
MSQDRLYQEQLLELARLARNNSMQAEPTHRAEMLNPSCGDKVMVALIIDQQNVKSIDVKVRGCAICEAAAGLMYHFSNHHDSTMLNQMSTAIPEWFADDNDTKLPDHALEPLIPVKLSYRNRIRCATLPFEAYTLAKQSPLDLSNKP